ncbi:MAG: helix-turn-helix domain-containing protein [Methylophilaceae bacterium]
MSLPALLSEFAPVVVYVPLQDACKIYGISDAMLRRLCRSGHVEAVKHGRGWLVNIAAPRKPGTRGPQFINKERG